MTEERLKKLDRLAAPLRRAGKKVETRLLRGTPFLEIIREVLRRSHDLVIMTTEGKVGLRGALFGSTSHHLLRKCPCPVLLVRPAKRFRLTRVLAAVDPSSDDSRKTGLDLKIMNAASSLARSYRSELHVAHAWTLYGESLMRSRRLVPTEELDEMLRESRQKHKRVVMELVDSYVASDRRLQTHVVKGLPEHVIPGVTRKARINLLVMGTVCRTGIAGFLIGNTAEKILNTITCSVLTLKPDGFVTPVTLEETRS
jgi:nucleotide-binding universal stress UspA family protein